MMLPCCMKSSCAAVAVQLDFLFFSVRDYRFAQVMMQTIERDWADRVVLNLKTIKGSLPNSLYEALDALARTERASIEHVIASFLARCTGTQMHTLSRSSSRQHAEMRSVAVVRFRSSAFD